MGVSSSRKEEPQFYSSSSTESDNEDLVPIPQHHQPNDQINMNLAMDAINPSSHSNGGLPSRNLTFSSLKLIENQLDDYEKISLIFLLCDNCLDAISLQDVFRKDAGLNWQEKLLEALAIIKNFQIPNLFGFSKDELIREYMPFRYFTSKCISISKKVLYMTCEKLTKQDEIGFLKEIKKDLTIKNIKFIEYPQLEMYFSYFLQKRYICENNVSNLIRIFKTMGLEEICDMLKSLQDEKFENVKNIYSNNMNRSVSADDTSPNSNFVSNIIDVSLAESNYTNSTQDNTKTTKQTEVKRTENIYDMSKDRICLIIDQEDFYTEIDEEYKDLLPDNIEEEQLRRRYGTLFDSQRLEATLKRRHFRVKIKRNLPHEEMKEELEKTLLEIDATNCSCLFVIILSHGDDGVVYGANSCYIEISTLIEIMSNRKLNDIPKVLIIQSCQGSTLQTVPRPNDDIDTDGPSLKHNGDLKSPHFLLFSSTVSGFSSVRDKQSGTWFIQSLCNQLENSGDKEHFEDICLNIKNEVIQKRWKKSGETEYYMVPISKSTLTGKLFLRM